MIPWEFQKTTTICLFYNKIVIFLLFFCLCILSSHCRPIYYKGEPVVLSSGTNNNESMIVRVIVSSSSSSSSSSTRDAIHEVTNYDRGYIPLSSLVKRTTTTSSSSSTFSPTTYHPEFNLPPISRSVRAKMSLTNDNIFSVFYRAFSEQGDKDVPRSNLHMGFQTQRPSEITNVSVDAKVISVVSHSRSVSASRNEENLDILNRMIRKNNSQVIPESTTTLPNINQNEEEPKDEALTQVTVGPKGMNSPEKVWGQDEKNWSDSEKVWGEHEKVWGDTLKIQSEPRKIWIESEKVWSKAEKVWGTQENVWRKQEKVQNSQRVEEEDQPPRIYEIPLTPIVNGDEEDSQQGKFYELGEDEEAEPQELILKESDVKAKVEEAQLASRSWELPELNTQVVDHSLTSTVEMMSESIQVPQTQNININLNIKQRPAGSKAIENTNVSVSERPGKKFGYVLDNSDVRKYRVEERTPDGYIVGEYGVINHDNGFLRGVRYTADGTINPRLIHEALMKFLAL